MRTLLLEPSGVKEKMWKSARLNTQKMPAPRDRMPEDAWAHHCFVKTCEVRLPIANMTIA